jgi:hypothetical protein
LLKRNGQRKNSAAAACVADGKALPIADANLWSSVDAGGA